ncbi:MAG: LysM peptidoglycan-binding domain-containing protein [Candidatus Promineofilum sp.]|nr:LysM peptidoglycan-binding domain-containing protein [Promineifilum sp.]MCW5864142.1 LysM peptidoglycan-binding domain-containing protein [Anaerolineae bacterium]
MKPPRLSISLALLALAVLALAACARRPEPTPTPTVVAELTIPATSAASATATTTPQAATAPATATNTATPAPLPATSTPTAALTTTVPAVPTNTATAPPVVVCAPRSDWPVYTVQRGDTLFRIAQRVGSSVAELSAANCLANPNVLPAGALLFVPRLPQPTATATATATAPAPPWTTFNSATIGVRFSYPAHWTVQQAEPYPSIAGPDGFVRVSLLSNPQEIDLAASQEAFNGLYGTNPTIETTTLAGGFPARVIRPSAEVTGHIQAALLAYLPAPVFVADAPYNTLLLAADAVHFQAIVNTLQMPPKPANAGVNLFNATAEPLPDGGRRVTFTWDSFGVTRGTIAAGTTERYAPWWPVMSRGQMTVELAGTGFPNPPMTLYLWNDVTGQEAQATVNIDWPCAHEYFFVPAPARCPAAATLRTTGVYQRFERGFMIWLRQPDGATTVLAFLDGGELRRATDLWAEGMPESDPSIIPPAGLFQPVRGFGKVWREDADLRARLGWAVAPEQSYDLVYQAEARTSLPSVSYVTRPDAAVLQMMDFTWTVFMP